MAKNVLEFRALDDPLLAGYERKFVFDEGFVNSTTSGDNPSFFARNKRVLCADAGAFNNATRCGNVLANFAQLVTPVSELGWILSLDLSIDVVERVKVKAYSLTHIDLVGHPLLIVFVVFVLPASHRLILDKPGVAVVDWSAHLKINHQTPVITQVLVLAIVEEDLFAAPRLEHLNKLSFSHQDRNN